jgi:hypothetical protein
MRLDNRAADWESHTAALSLGGEERAECGRLENAPRERATGAMMSRIAKSSAPSSAAMATGAVIVVGGIVIGLTGMTSMMIIIKRQLNERFCRGEQFPHLVRWPMIRTLPATEVEQLPVAPKIEPASARSERPSEQDQGESGTGPNVTSLRRGSWSNTVRWQNTSRGDLRKAQQQSALACIPYTISGTVFSSHA